MDQQDQENFQEESTMDEEQENQEINFAQDDETAGSVSNGRILVKLKLPKMPEETAAPPPAGEIKTHYCKECDKYFSSGKALGGHMSSAHVQANKDYSYKKLKSGMTMGAKYFSGSCSGSGSGLEDSNACVICGKRFPSQKSLYGHMRCHPDRDYRGMEPPSAEGKMDSSEASTGPELEYMDDEGQMGPGPDLGIATLMGWPVTVKRGRSTRPGSSVSPPAPKLARVSSPEEEKEAVSAGHQLLRLLKRNEDPIRPGPKSESGDQSKKSGSDHLANHEPESEPKDHLKKSRSDHLANHGPGSENQARDNKRQNPGPDARKLRIREPDPDAIDERRKIKEKINDDKGKGKAVVLSEPDEDSDTDSDSEYELYLAAVRVLANAKRENRTTGFHKPVAEDSAQSKARDKLSPARQKVESGSTSSPEKFACSTCKKCFPTHQALGGHRSSHNKFKIHIVNAIDDDNFQANKKPKKTEIVKQGDENGNLHVCKICNKSFASGKALGGHKRCHNINADNNKEEEEKVFRGFDLNKMPDDDGNGDGEGDPRTDTSNGL
ncbi:hypothetical protein DH2020_020936 [Rehmannia glutinosa]|uniref:C2H2-type domain-containing protein n=1 Tax=Rehmannia glutinosa TaxID=99300 RepID=A0ABR0WBF5_REHGL